MQKLIYKSEIKAQATVAGVTKVTLEVDGTLIELGTVMNFAGKKEFTAVLLDGSTLSDGHITKKQAGGALKKRHDVGAAPVASTAPVATVPVQMEKPIEPVVPVAEPEVVEATVADEIDEDYEPSHGRPLGDILLDMEEDDPDDLLAIPAFLRRGPSLVEEV